MKSVLAIRLIFTLAMMVAVPHAASAQAPDFSNVECPSDKDLVREVLEMQVAGIRVPGRKDSCVAQENFPHIIARPPPAGEAGTLPAIKYVSEKQPFEIRSIQKDERGRLVVDFVYNILSGGKTIAVEDHLVVRRYDGFGKKHFGCASAVLLPVQYVIRRSCVANSTAD